VKSARVVPDMTMMHDPVHGPVTLKGWHGTAGDVLALLTRSPELGRLRHIKQLGLAAYGFPAADHSRYAHALGTAHVMQRLLEGRVEDQLRKIETAQLCRCFPDLEQAIGGAEGTAEAVARHLLIAALIQDVGELPYAHATWRLLRAGPDVKSRVRQYTGTDGDFGDAKAMFTANFACSSPLLVNRDDVDIAFLLFLLFGKTAPQTKGLVPAQVTVLRHLVDGVVDADRLDYVYRDAHHTFGNVGGPQAVVDSLVRVDKTGPVFVEPGPVMDFVSVRSSVWSRVYFEAQNRFRITLLRVILRAVRGSEAAQEAFFGFSSDGHLSVEDWMRVDDAFVQMGLERLHEDSGVKRGLRETSEGRSALVALDLYIAGSTAFEAEWLPPPATPTASDNWSELPDDLFFDTCADFRHHRLYERGSIRIAGPRFSRCDPPVDLERCAGPLDGALQVTWFPLAIRGSVLLFLPESRQGEIWNKFERGIADGSLHAYLVRMDEEQRLTAPDTRALEGYSGPDVFISYAFKDRDFVDRVLDRLRARRQRYFLLENAVQGTGMTAKRNSAQAVAEAGAALFVLSSNFKNRVAEDPDGNLQQEIEAVCERHLEDGLPVAFVAADELSVVKNAFPWSEIGLKEPALMVGGLRDADNQMLAEAVDRAVTQIEETRE
jgi:HD superfamily phosphohydrolase